MQNIKKIYFERKFFPRFFQKNFSRCIKLRDSIIHLKYPFIIKLLLNHSFHLNKFTILNLFYVLQLSCD